MTPYQVVLGQKWKNRTTRLRDILPFRQGHALKRVMQKKSHKRKKNLFGQRINFAFMLKIDLLVKKVI